ncbi:N-acetylmuramoyl-L-alanine amidase [Bradyrhizobium sp. Arg816]|uniref:peptidoglycan recognition protein family protein n=1 Tax=Bradyrhizobium sp. Arg816 TaxID=2998491 RepID=UPI00249F045C|nr:N-acetylmuramoyl-L-alanine amidase [Bradyrhizobium sp. Arg816]MDI3560057.1 hypothetical protein [Bradyrhizobium sp. Arg816]
MARCPFARWMPLPWSAGQYTAGPFRIIHHTTEGSTAAGAFATYQDNGHDIPHFTVDDQFIYQHLDTEVAARALAHPPGTVETNRFSAIQFELVGFAGRPKSQASLTNVGRLCRWIESTHNVPGDWPNGYPNPPDRGHDPGHHNRNEQNWRTRGGHYGHCHVPANSHWDPAYTAAELQIVMSVPAADAAHQIVAETAELPEMAARADLAKPKRGGRAKKAKAARKAKAVKKRKAAPKRARKRSQRAR